jgi:hypothetical protein
MPSSGMLRPVAVIRTEVSEERITSIIRVKRIGQHSSIVFVHSMSRLLVTANVVPNSPILVPMIMEVIRSPETSVPTRATQRNIPEGGTLQKKIRVTTLDGIAICGHSFRSILHLYTP